MWITLFAFSHVFVLYLLYQIKNKYMTHTEILQKAKALHTNSQIRIDATGDFWVFNFGGILFIGTQVCENPKGRKYYPNDPVYTMKNKSGEEVAHMQKLY